MVDPVIKGRCLDPEEIAMLLEGCSSASWRGRLEEHMASCSRCRELVSALVKLEASTEQRLPSTSMSAASSLSAGLVSVPLAAGLRVGRYEVLSCLGQGGMGAVYCAWDPELGRKVALKLLTGTDRTTHTQLRDRLRREAQAMAQVTHPHVVTVFDVGMWEDRIFIAMEFIAGQTLSQWLASGTRGWREILAMFLAAGEGLAGAHAAGIVHRDFKPANVLVGRDGRVCVSDFGLAATTSDAAPSSRGWARMSRGDGTTEHGTTGTSCLGTPFFMAPEQLRGAPPDVRSDQYSFCVALHLAITGEHPFPGHSMEEVLNACLEGRPRRTAHPRMPRALWRVIRRGVSVDRADRHRSMSAMLAALRGHLSRRRRGAVSACAAVAGVALAGVLATRNAVRSSTEGGEPSSARAAPRGDTSVLDGTPALLEAYAREWDSLHDDACALSRAGCSLQVTNLLQNADFGRAQDAWYVADGRLALAWVSGWARAIAGARGGVLAQARPWIISPLHTYRFTVWMRAAMTAAPGRGQLVLSTRGSEDLHRAITRFSAGPTWSEVTVALSGEVRRDLFRAELALDPFAAVDVDHAELVDAGLRDPGFELESAAAWRPVNSAHHVRMSRVETDAIDGVRALEVMTTAVGGSVAQDTTRAPVTGTTYTFSAWLRAGSAGSSVAGNVALWALGGDETFVYTGFQVGSEWTKVEASLYVRDHGHSSLRAELYVETVDAALQIDATSLMPAGLVDASFEHGALGWYSPEGEAVPGHLRGADLDPRRIDTGSPWRWRTDGAKDGIWWLRLSGGQRRMSIAQDLGRPVPGISYRFSAWVRAAPGSAAPVAGDIAIHGLSGARESGRTAFHASAEWTLVAAALTVRDDDQRGLRVVIALDSPGAQLDIDGTRLSGAIVLPSATVPAAP